jgi:hypothetical protein
MAQLPPSVRHVPRCGRNLAMSSESQSVRGTGAWLNTLTARLSYLAWRLLFNEVVWR